MSTEPAPTDLTIACHVRPTLVLEPIDAKIETLRQCERDGTIDSLLLRSWPGEVAMLEDTPHPEVLDQYDRFTDWADRADVSIHPPFQTRETTSIASERTIDRLVTPTICLAVYDRDRLVGVFPHSDGETTYTVPEAIASLRTGELPEALLRRGGVAERTTPRPATAPPSGDLPSWNRPTMAAGESRPACPDCGDDLTNVQGILDCDGCEWIGADRTIPLVTGR
ncbi:hypothetical protein L593_03540 [Salinarchaeum sp. Harcht-Bsk1]|uniref:HTH domain-containing protein n=1 Tax=Salinarchaeum sp. Harcht-Bsk1 TaxID=1333523 RepID=UPI0003423315|nr:HTH domain-containing protein [Salinarchaeum sp. Harcht-Bsk1]AGN00659.1 hypothetical protein L593_03540 [Salinarchaeum sp. Harcht-Bsk1]